MIEVGGGNSPTSIGSNMAEIDDVMDKLDDVLDKIADLSEQIENLEMVNYNLCTMCQGSGQVIPSYNGDTPPPSITCPSCNGAGKISLGSAKEKD